MCGGLKITRVSFGRTSSAGLVFFLVRGGHELFHSLQHPLVPRRPIVHLRRKGPHGSVNSECEPVVHRRAVCGSERLEIVLETIHPILLRASLAWIFPPDEFSVHQPLLRCFIAVRTLWLNLSARCLSWFTGRFNRPTPSDSTPSSRLWCIPAQCAALPFLSGLSPLRSPLLHNPGVHAGALGFNHMLLPKLDRREIPRSRDRGNFYRSNPGSPSIRGSGSCLRLCRVVFACYTPTGGSRSTPAGAGQGDCDGWSFL